MAHKLRDITIRALTTELEMDACVAQDMEAGVYNWTIAYADSTKILKGWKTPAFARAYMEKARSVISNMDKTSYIRNTELAGRLEGREFLPHDVAFMTPEDAFPALWNDVVDKHLKKKANAFNHKVSAQTNVFWCGKCKKNECSYYEMQTRCADEASTIFVKCVNCGNSWRIG